MSAPTPSTAAIALAPMVQVWTTLLAAHVPDREGRCVACRWQTRAADKWPCAVYLLSAAAQRVAAMSQEGPRPDHTFGTDRTK
ncbi:MAG: hypothetical protein ACRDQ0_07835 [Pseudonocardia sp.]